MVEDIKSKTRFKRFVKWVVFRFPLFLVIIGAVMIGALKLVERYPVPLTQGFEEYLSKTTGTSASIGKLERIKFFPNFDIHIQDLTMHNYDNAAIVDLDVDTVKISSPFFTMLFSGNKLNGFLIENLTSKAGLITPLDLKINTASLVDKNGPDQYGSFFSANGQYGGKDLFFEAEVQKKGRSYFIPAKIPFSIRVGGSALNAELDKGFTEVHLRNAVFSKGEKTSSADDYPLVKMREYNKNNPLMCLLENGDAPNCDIYLDIISEDKKESVQE